MRPIKSTLKTIAFCTLMTLGARSVYAQQENSRTIDARLGYNAVETAITTNKDARIRTYIGAELAIGPAQLNISGMNQAEAIDGTRVDANTYFGRNVAALYEKGANTGLCAVINTTMDGMVDKKYGIETSELIKRLKCYGEADFTANSYASNATVFIGKDVGRGISLELYQSTEIPFRGCMSNYTELQLNKDITRNVKAFARAEMTQGTANTYLVGVLIHN